MTADPYRASAGAGDPGSWNRYAYASSDSINYYDPRGLQSEEPKSRPPTWCPTLERWVWEGESCPGVPDATPPSSKTCQDGSIVGQNDPCPFDDQVMAERLGLANATKGLKVISGGGFKSKPKCAQFLGALAKQRGISTQTLMDGIAEAAGAGQVFEAQNLQRCWIRVDSPQQQVLESIRLASGSPKMIFGTGCHNTMAIRFG